MEREDGTTLLRRFIWGMEETASKPKSKSKREISRHETEMDFWRMGKMIL